MLFSVEKCKELASDPSTISEIIPGFEVIQLKDVHPERLKKAEEEEGVTPVKMGGAGATDIIYSVLKATNSRKIIETGVAYGWSSFAILCHLDDINDGHLISIDRPYPGLDNEAYVGAIVPQDLRGRWTLLRGSDRQMLPIALDSVENLDFVHYDSDKSHAGRMYAYPLLWDALVPGGVLMSDDIGDNMAFIEFAQASGASFKIIAIRNKHVGLMVKPRIANRN